jgi:hypothetical protein
MRRRDWFCVGVVLGLWAANAMAQTPSAQAPPLPGKQAGPPFPAASIGPAPIRVQIPPPPSVTIEPLAPEIYVQPAPPPRVFMNPGAYGAPAPFLGGSCYGGSYSAPLSYSAPRRRERWNRWRSGLRLNLSLFSERESGNSRCGW